MTAPVVGARDCRCLYLGSTLTNTIARLFYETVRSVNRADYSEEQVEAWAPAIPDAGEWHDRMAGRKTLVAEESGGRGDPIEGAITEISTPPRMAP